MSRNAWRRAINAKIALVTRRKAPCFIMSCPCLPRAIGLLRPYRRGLSRSRGSISATKNGGEGSGVLPPLAQDTKTALPWGRRLEASLDRYPTLRAIGQTPLVPVHLFDDELPGVEVLAKMEPLNPGGSLKDRPVLRMLLGALADGRLQPGKIILDSSSGNAGIAYAMIGRVLGYPVEIVIPANASLERKKRLLAHGARLTFTDALKGYDEALREVHRRYHTDTERYFFCDQYSNPDNWRAHYETTAPEILEQTGGQPPHVGVRVGTRGPPPGGGGRFKEHRPRTGPAFVAPGA